MSFIGSLFKGPSTNVTFPERSPEEAALLKEQTNILRQQQKQLQESLRQQNLLQPLLFGQLGIQEVRDASGNVLGYERTPAGLQQEQIEGKLRERTLAALEGNLPVDPALERSIEGGRQDLRDRLLRQLGPGFETSSPGIEALAEFDQRAEELRFGARTGTLATSEALAGAREERGAATFGNIMRAGEADLPFIGAGTGIGTAFSGPLSNMMQDRSLLAQTRAQSASNALSKYGTNLGFTASLFSSIFGKGK